MCHASLTKAAALDRGLLNLGFSKESLQVLSEV